MLGLAVFIDFTLLSAQGVVFSKTATAYVPLTGATQVAKDSVWDEPDQWSPADRLIDLGFTFNAFGKSFSTMTLEQGAAFFKEGDTVVYMGIMADLCDYGYGTKNPKSPVFRKREGTAGNYIMKLEWRSFGFWDQWNSDGSCSDSANLQLWIYQNPQKVELRFGPKKIADFSGLFPDKLPVWCAKYDGVGNTQGIVLDGNPINPSSFPFADTGTRGLSDWPTANQVYVFTFSTAGAPELALNQFNFWYTQGEIICEKTGDFPIEVRTVTGKQMIKSKMNEGRFALNHVLSPGIYMVSLTLPDGQQATRKVFINE